MRQRQFPIDKQIVQQDLVSEAGKVAASLAEWGLGLGVTAAHSIVCSYGKTPSQILEAISRVSDLVVTDRGELGTTVSGNAVKVGEYKLIAAAEHSFNAVVCCFYGPEKYNLNNTGDATKFNAMFSVSNRLKSLKEGNDIVSVSFYPSTAHGLSLSFDGAPIAQQVYDSDYWDVGSAEPTTSEEPPLWFAGLQSASTPSSSKGGGCYVATAVYGSYDCPQVWTLRRFRDFSLATSVPGRAFIRAYYAVSPAVVRLFGDTIWFNRLWRARLDRMVARLNREGFADTPYED